MLRLPLEGALPQRVPGAYRARPVPGSDVRGLVEVDEPTFDLMLRVRDALCAWVATGAAGG